MKTVSLTEFKNNFSSLVDLVKKGRETLIISERKVPILRVVPVSQDSECSHAGLLDRLERAGLLLRASSELSLSSVNPVKASNGNADILATLLAERDEGR